MACPRRLSHDGMEKAQRVELIRRSYKANGGIPFAFTGIKAPKQEPATPKRAYMPWPDIIVDTKRAPRWMKQSSSTVQLAFRPKRETSRESALTLMSRKLCLKLPLMGPPTVATLQQ